MPALQFLAPWALVGLVSLPVLWWLLRRREDPVLRELPGLHFFDAEDVVPVSRRRLFNPLLLVALGAAAAITLAAALPTWTQERARLRVLVVQEAMLTRDFDAYADALNQERERIQAAVGDGELVWRTIGDGAIKRVGAHVLHEVALSGEADARIVLSAHPAPEAVGPVTWRQLPVAAEPPAHDVGIVAVGVEDAGGEHLLHATVHNAGTQATAVILTHEGSDPSSRAAPTHLRPGESARCALALPAAKGRVRCALKSGTAGVRLGGWRADDWVVLEREPVSVGLYGKPEARVRQAIEAAVEASGRAKLSGSTTASLVLFADPAGAAYSIPGRLDSVSLQLESQTRATDLEVPSSASLIARTHPVTRDLPPVARVRRLDPGSGALCMAGMGSGMALPVLTRHQTSWRLLAPLLGGSPELLETAFLPILIDNFLTWVGGENVGLGYRARGVLDYATTTGWTNAPAELVPHAYTFAAPKSRPARCEALPALLLAAGVLLALLWFFGWRRAR